MKQYYKRHFLDRYDGWRVRKVDAVYAAIPFFMRTRNDSQNLYEELFPIDEIEAFIRKHREEMPELSIMHVIIAAIIRMISQKPYTNRFVVWNKIYARNHINLSLMIKRKLSNEETSVKPDFEPDATLQDVVKIMSECVNENIQEGANNSTDSTTRLLAKLPSFVMRTITWILFKLDNIGKLPKGLHKTSPWHCSAFLTNLGSLGIGPIYHHLYEFGTCSMFCAMGNKIKKNVLNDDGTVSVKKFIGLKFVLDERICDGKYYAQSFKVLRKYLKNPELLMTPPEEIVVDDGVGRPLYT